jgi:hypothetical protein
MCSNCQYPKKKLWAIGPPYPKWETLQAANFVSLVTCITCAQRWVEIPYEPFASFRYAVPWLLSEAAFAVAMNKDAGLTLSKWHEAEVRYLANAADKQTRSQIEAHYNRSRGFVDLRPTNRPNAISLDT